MAQAAGMVIPRLKPKELTNDQVKALFEELGSDIKGMFTKTQKKELQKRKEEIDRADLQKKNEKKIIDILNPPAGIKKMQTKITKYWHKWTAKDFMKTVLGFLKGLLQSAGSWLMKILKFLLFFAIFDPKGTFLTSILDFIISMAETLIKAILPMLPVIAKRMWNLFWKVLVPGFKRFGKMIGDSLFGKDTILSKIMETVGGLIPIFVVVMGIISKLGFLFPMLKGLMGILAANPIIAIIAAIALIYVFSDEIVAFFDDLKKSFDGLSTKWKIVIGALMFPILPLIALVYNLAKLFKTIKPYINMIRKIGIKKFVTMLKHVFMSMLKGLVDSFLSFVMSIPSKIGDAFKNFGAGVTESAKAMIPKWLKDAILKIRNFLMSIVDWVGAFMTDPAAYINPLMGEKERSARIDAAKIAVQVKRELEEGGGKAGTVSKTAKIDAEIEKAREQKGTLTKEDIQQIILAKTGRNKEQTAALRQQVEIVYEKKFKTLSE